MFSFFDNMSKAREEWLNKPAAVPNTAAYLNAFTKLEARTKLEAKTNASTK